MSGGVCFRVGQSVYALLDDLHKSGLKHEVKVETKPSKEPAATFYIQRFLPSSTQEVMANRPNPRLRGFSFLWGF